MSTNPFTEQRAAPQQSPDSTVKVLLIILGIVGVMGLVICGGLFGMGYYAYQQIQRDISVGEFAAEEEDQALAVQDAVRESPELLAEIGTVSAVTCDDDLTAEKQALSDDTADWYRVEGDKGAALLRVEFSEVAGKWFDAIELVQKDESNMPLTIAHVPYDSVENREIYWLVHHQSLVHDGVGEIKWFSLDWDKTESETISGDEKYWYSVIGEKGVGYVIASEGDEVRLLEFVYPDGRRVAIPEQPSIQL